ncbi:MAG: PHP domain-containing protein [Clostridia bacterium]|nr:PHP domain-containing protein [Clostridia bacterium]
MTRYKYDLHIHSCLSPCADDDMTPANIAGMAHLNGLQLLALTDHNSCKNCPAFFEACRQYGIVPVPGMELCTAEEIHVVCLFSSLADAMAFGSDVEKHLLPISNKPDIFGNQLVVDAEDNVLEAMDTLLINASTLSLPEAVSLCLRHSGACFPAHIDRESHGIVAVLGGLPEDPEFRTIELSRLAGEDCEKNFPGKLVLHSSDAHHLWDIGDGTYSLEIDDEPYSSARVREELLKKIKNGLL